MAEPYAVVLHCARETRVDIVVADNETAAIGEIIARAFRSAAPPELPLLATYAAQIPRSVLSELAGQVTPPPLLPPPPPRVHVVGLLQIARAYSQAVGGGDDKGAKAKLVEFFQHYGIEIDFTVARPLPPRQGNGQLMGNRDGAS